MLENFFELFKMPFVINAFLGLIPLCILCGVIGTLICVNRLSYVAGGLTHGTYGGVGIGVYFSLPILVSAGIFTLIIAWIAAFLILRYKTQSDQFIGAIWAFGMALGIILLELSKGYKADMMGYLFGNILVLSSLNLYLLWGAGIICVALVWYFYPQFQALSYDDEFAKIMGVNQKGFFYLLMMMIAICVSLSMQAVGLILVISLLSISTFIAQSLSKTLKEMMIYCTILNLVFCILGLLLSFYFDLSSGASIILISVGGMAIFFISKYLLDSLR
ncbi:metal ABC transporter permease [Helicobacter pylori]